MKDCGSPTAGALIKTEWLVGLLGLVFGLFVVLGALRVSGGDPLFFAALGQDDNNTSAVIQEHLGRTGPLREGMEHDGKFFLVQAWDPLYLSR